MKHNRIIILAIIATIVAGMGIYACKEDKALDNTKQESTLSAERKKNKPIIRKSGICIAGQEWHWIVQCSDTTWDEGYAGTKKEAKKAAKGACSIILQGSGNIYVSIMSPFLDDPQGSLNTLFVDGFIKYLDVINPWTDEFHRFTQDDISVNALAWLSEICDYDEASLSQVNKVVAQLKVWDVYLGGNSMDEIKLLHNLTTEQFHAIAAKSWDIITIEQKENSDGTVRLVWTFEY